MPENNTISNSNSPAANQRPMSRPRKVEETSKSPAPASPGGAGGGDGVPWTQNGRLIKIVTPLPDPNALILRELHGQEAVSSLFKYDLEMYSENPNLDLKALVNAPVTLRIRLFDDDDDHGKPHDRLINGIVSEFSQYNTTPRFTHYRATVRPKFWLLTQSTDCKIFQDMSVPDIVEKVLKDHGVTDFEFALDRSKYNIREYCVQYRESAFNFLSRLMEEEGIFYYFVHDMSHHTMIFGDEPSHFRVCKDQPEAFYRPVDMESQSAASPVNKDAVTDFIGERQVRPTSYVLREYDFMEPSKTLEVSTQVDEAENGSGGGSQKREIFDYPGEYTGGPEPQRENFWMMLKEGERYVKLRKEEDAEDHTFFTHGASTCRAFVTGHKFELKEHNRGDFNRPYVLISLETHAFQSDIFNEPNTYCRNEFTCLPDGIPFRPQRLTPIPVVHGSQTAVVVGPAGEEIYTDKFGRVKVQFHWDRYGTRNENSSCWLRVATLWAGSNWGYIQLPRIGHEVIVDFLEGDPDKPYVSGSFYNGDNMPPYPLDSASTTSKQGNYKTVSTRKSRSTLHGTPNNYNEIRYEDLKDYEQIFVHAERDMDTHVKRDSREHILRDRHLIVNQDQREEVQRDKHGHVNRNRTLEVGGRRDTKIGSIDVIDAGQEIHLKAGNQIILEAGSLITLKVGANFINVTPSAIHIKAPAGIVYIQDQGAPGNGSQVETGPLPDMADDGMWFDAKPRTA